VIFFFSLSDNGTYHFWSLSFPWRLKSNINCICWIRRKEGGEKKKINLSLLVLRRFLRGKLNRKQVSHPKPNYMMYFYSGGRHYTRLGSTSNTKDPTEQGQSKQRSLKAYTSFRNGCQNHQVARERSQISGEPCPIPVWLHLRLLRQTTKKPSTAVSSNTQTHFQFTGLEPCSRSNLHLRSFRKASEYFKRH